MAGGRSTGPVRRKTSSQAPAAPYPRKGTEPKSTRQQYSACGACRIRRVRCDLKDLATANPGAQELSCSNCKERQVRCVDEFADVQQVKQLRRGRRLQQVRERYGNNSADEGPENADALPSAPSAPHPRVHRPANLTTALLGSSCLQHLSLLRPVLDIGEFGSRYLDVDGHAPSPQLDLCASAFVMWAASFGVDNAGASGPFDENAQQGRLAELNATVHQMLETVDTLSIMRKPTMDGMAALLMLLPMTREALNIDERVSIHDTVLCQVRTKLLDLSDHPARGTKYSYEEANVASRIFYQAYIHEGLTAGLSGSVRIAITEEDLLAFQAVLPPWSPLSTATAYAGGSLAGPSIAPGVLHQPLRSAFDVEDPGAKFSEFSQLMVVPLQIATLCRRIHTYLTGPRASQAAYIDKESIEEIWGDLHNAWNGLDRLKDLLVGSRYNLEAVWTFSSAWQLKVFECCSIVCTRLQQRLETNMGDPNVGGTYQNVRRKCREMLPNVMMILQQSLAFPDSALLAYDPALVRDAIFCAGATALQSDLEPDMYIQWCSDDHQIKEYHDICVAALRRLRWAFSQREHRLESMERAYLSWQERAAARSIPVPPRSGPSRQQRIAGPRPFSAEQTHSSSNSSLVDGRPQLPPLQVPGHSNSFRAGPLDAALTYTPPSSGDSDPHTPWQPVAPQMPFHGSDVALKANSVDADIAQFAYSMSVALDPRELGGNDVVGDFNLRLGTPGDYVDHSIPSAASYFTGAELPGRYTTDAITTGYY